MKLKLLVFIPVFLKYGGVSSGILSYSYPPIHSLIVDNFFYIGTIRVWGELALFSIILAIAYQSIAHRKSDHQKKAVTPMSVSNRHVVAWILAIFLYLVLFVRFPLESGYLIPIVPFVILLLVRFLERRLLIFACISITLSSCININESGIHRGLIFANHSTRIEIMQYVEEVLSSGRGLHEKSVIVTGALLPKIRVELSSTSQGMVKYVELLKAHQLEEYLEQGYKIYYISDVFSGSE